MMADQEDQAQAAAAIRGTADIKATATEQEKQDHDQED